MREKFEKTAADEANRKLDPILSTGNREQEDERGNECE